MKGPYSRIKTSKSGRYTVASENQLGSWLVTSCDIRTGERGLVALFENEGAERHVALRTQANKALTAWAGRN